MKEQTFNGKDLIFVINYLTQLRGASDSSRAHEEAAVWLFSAYMSVPALSAIEALSTLSFNLEKQHEGTITSYARVMRYLLRGYATDAVIAKADEEIRNFKDNC